MRWTLKAKPELSKVSSLKEALKVDTLVATLLAQRGIETYEEARTFFRPNLDDLHDPFLMKDMDRAVKRITSAIEAESPILVYGDYDVDGTTSVAMMATYLATKTNAVATYIPDRYDEGYGVSYAGIDFAHDNGFDLIIALDCGVKAVEKIAYAKEKGIDFIICDHHRPGDELPDAVAVLDPKRPDCSYPYKELCGCGVGFKLIQALGSSYGEAIEEHTSLLDLVATAIAADIVPITGENRTLAYFGLQVINAAPRVGIKAILEHVKKETLTITDVVFIIAPRINAAGRMKHGNHAVKLLMEEDMDQALEFATEINQYNSDRKEADKQITIEALDQIELNNEQERSTTVVYDPSWHKGVIGIVASRLIETYYKPTLVFTKSGDVLAASARSVKGFDVYKALEACSEHLIQFGGHKYAAGLTIAEKNYDCFKNAFEEVVENTWDEALRTPEVMVDAEIHLSSINSKFYRILSQFTPFGPGNMTPVFMTQNLMDTGYGKCVGENRDHLKLVVTENGDHKIGAIGFNLGKKIDLSLNRKTFKAVYTIDENHWNGNVSLQLKLKDIKP